MLLGILFQLIVFILIFGAGISCCGNFSKTFSVSICDVCWDVSFCIGGGGIGTSEDTLCTLMFGGGGGGGALSPAKKKQSQYENILVIVLQCLPIGGGGGGGPGCGLRGDVINDGFLLGLA